MKVFALLKLRIQKHFQKHATRGRALFNTGFKVPFLFLGLLRFLSFLLMSVFHSTLVECRSRKAITRALHSGSSRFGF
jgi:hypothetical protein